MAKRRPKLPVSAGTLVVSAWAVVTTLATLYLGYGQYRADTAVSQLDAREKLDSLMLAIRQEYELYCDKSSETLWAGHRPNFDALIAVASVDVSRPPYDKPCMLIPTPGAPGALAVTTASGINASSYGDWGTFAADDNKQAVLWIAKVPLLLNVNSADWSVAEVAHRAMLKQMEDCTREERAKVEHTFIQLECMWGFDDEKKTTALYRVESR